MPTGSISKIKCCSKKLPGWNLAVREHQRIIDRVTVLKADTTILFTDAKDGLYGIRLAHALQIPTDKDQEFKDDKGNVTVVKGGTDHIRQWQLFNQ